MKHERAPLSLPETETSPLDVPLPGTATWNVYNASGTHTATYPTEGGARAHLDAWPSGLTYRAA